MGVCNVTQGGVFVRQGLGPRICSSVFVLFVDDGVDDRNVTQPRFVLWRMVSSREQLSIHSLARGIHRSSVERSRPLLLLNLVLTCLIRKLSPFFNYLLVSV